MDVDDGLAIERCIDETTLSGNEENSAAYVAGWLEKKCDDLVFPEDEPRIPEETKTFIDDVSNGYLTVPHVSTYEFVRTGLCYVKSVERKVCCRSRLVKALLTMNSFYDFGAVLSSKHLLRRLENVLLHGLHILEKDHARNSTLYQTSIKKARLAE